MVEVILLFMMINFLANIISFFDVKIRVTWKIFKNFHPLNYANSSVIESKSQKEENFSFFLSSMSSELSRHIEVVLCWNSYIHYWNIKKRVNYYLCMLNNEWSGDKVAANYCIDARSLYYFMYAHPSIIPANTIIVLIIKL